MLPRCPIEVRSSLRLAPMLLAVALGTAAVAQQPAPPEGAAPIDPDAADPHAATDSAEAGNDDPGDPDDPDDPAPDRSAAELEAVRRAEERAGLLPSAPGLGPLDGLAIGLGPFDPTSQDLAAAFGASVDGAPLADPVLAFGTAVSLPELAGISAEELKAKYDIPMELNDAVVAYIRFFQTDAREHFAKWLGRAARWQPLMRPLLEKNGVPVDLVYLSMIESGYNPYAYSFAKAAGLWQFVVGTSRRYGLTTDFWVDERRDPLRSTEAAAAYLADLKQRFHGDWFLAWAGYNAGEGKIEKAIKRDSTVDFWRMMTRGRTLRAETRHYVPKLLAAALIGKHPERFGFKVTPEGPWEYDEAEVTEPTSLSALAQAAGTTVDRLRELNPSLRRFCTPPGSFLLRLPKGSQESFTEKYQQLDEAGRLAATQHQMEKGDSLAKLTRAYGVSEQAILKANGLTKPNQVKVGKLLTIPLKASRGLALGEALEDRRKNGKPAGRTVREPARGRAITATPSNNYAQVARAREAALAAGKQDPAEEADARAAKATAEEAARRQRLATAKKLAGALLGQRAPAHAGVKGGTYLVRPGDNLWSIATKLGIPVDVLQKKNGLNKREARALRVGQALEVDG